MPQTLFLLPISIGEKAGEKRAIPEAIYELSSVPLDPPVTLAFLYLPYGVPFFS